MIKLPKQRPTATIGLGFFLIVAVMMSLVLYSLNRLQASHAELDDILTKHNAKIELVQVLRHIVRERMINMHQLVIEEDPFKRDEVIMRFHGMANKYIGARDKLEGLAQLDEEKRQYNKLRELVVWATPFHERVVDLLSREQLAEARQLLREESMPAQLKVMEQCDQILDYYKQAAQRVEKKAYVTYEQTKFNLIILSGIAASISFATALLVLKRAKDDREALQSAHDHLEEQVVERTAELNASIGQLAEAQQLSHMGHWEWNLEKDSMSWSDEVYRILGYAPHAFAASFEKLGEATHPDDREWLTGQIDKVLLDKVPFDFDQRIVRPDGTERIVHQKASVDFDASGKLIKLLGTMQDVTESKAVEAQLKLAANVFENAGEGIFITDRDNNIVDVNQAFTEITSFKRQDVIGQNPRVFKSGKHDPSFYREMWSTLLEKGQWQGEIWGKRKSGSVFPKWQSINVIRDDKGNILNYIAIFRDISDAKRYEEKLWKLAHFDNLTGVANRSLMYSNLRLAIAQSKRDNVQVAMLLFDLDGFKQINDTLGHDAGDQLLKHVTRQLSSVVRDVDTVARLGGDEFTVILTGMRNHDDVAVVARKMQTAMAQPLKLQSGEDIIAKASIGIALFPNDADDIETLMKNADRAMYTAKEMGKNNFQFFTEGMTTETKPGSPTS